MDAETIRRRDAFILALAIFNEIKGFRHDAPIPDYIKTGNECGFDDIYTRDLVAKLKQNNILKPRGGRDAAFTANGYELIQDTLNNPKNPPYFFPDVCDLI